MATSAIEGTEVIADRHSCPFESSPSLYLACNETRPYRQRGILGAARLSISAGAP